MVALGLIDVAAVVVGGSVFRLELNGLVAVGDGLVVAILLAMTSVQPRICRSLSCPWLQGRGLLRVSLGGVTLARSYRLISRVERNATGEHVGRRWLKWMPVQTGAYAKLNASSREAKP